ncbi:hypothetical protein AB5I41_30915 [Sphingomonas sp. MMS24-JH45]
MDEEPVAVGLSDDHEIADDGHPVAVGCGGKVARRAAGQINLLRVHTIHRDDEIAELRKAPSIGDAHGGEKGGPPTA